jgi:hypothetical protein
MLCGGSASILASAGIGGGPQVPTGLGEGGVRRDEGVLSIGVWGSKPLTSRSAERGLTNHQRGAHHRGEDRAATAGKIVPQPESSVIG